MLAESSNSSAEAQFGLDDLFVAPNGNDVWVADVGGLVRKNGPFRSLLVNGQRRPRAFFPKQGFYRIAEVPGITFDADLFAGTNCSDSEMALHAANCVRCFTSKSRLGWRRCCWVGGPVGAAAAQGLGGPPGATEVEDGSEEALRTALAAGGRVVFLLDGTISVTSTAAITNNALLDGNGHQVTISGNNETGVFSASPSVSSGGT